MALISLLLGQQRIEASLASIGREKMQSPLPSAACFEPRSVLPSTATTPRTISCNEATHDAKHCSRTSGFSNRKTLRNVWAWGMPVLYSKNRFSHARYSRLNSSIASQSSARHNAPTSVANQRRQQNFIQRIGYHSRNAAIGNPLHLFQKLIFMGFSFETHSNREQFKILPCRPVMSLANNNHQKID
jgi:hypothetical protein